MTEDDVSTPPRSGNGAGGIRAVPTTQRRKDALREWLGAEGKQSGRQLAEFMRGLGLTAGQGFYIIKACLKEGSVVRERGSDDGSAYSYQLVEE